MTVRVLYFAVLRERLGRDEEALPLPSGATAGEALAWLAAREPTIRSLVGRVQIAVNRHMVAPGHVLGEGDEVALIPPVAGGSDGAAPPHGPPAVAVLDAPLSLDAVVAAVSTDTGGAGAVVTFTGVVRRHGTLPVVERLAYEAYVPMAEAVMRAIVEEIAAAHGARVAIHHRTGTLSVGEAAVVIAVAAPRRAEAFAGCRQAIEALKARAPIWKKETGPDGDIWVGLGP